MIAFQCGTKEVIEPCQFREVMNVDDEEKVMIYTNARRRIARKIKKKTGKTKFETSNDVERNFPTHDQRIEKTDSWDGFDDLKRVELE